MNEMYIENIVYLLRDIRAKKTLSRIYHFVQALWRIEGKGGAA